MVKSVLTISLVAIVSGPILRAQQPTWAENIFKIKTGRTHPAFEARVNERKKAQEQASVERFSKLDRNKDGVISGGEWQQNSGIPASLDTDGDGAISMKEWTAASNSGSL